DDPKSSIIWEAFKADTEAKRGIGGAELAAQRDALLAAIRKGAAARNRTSDASAAAAPAASPTIAADSSVLVQ
ncbi:MAG TPA: hypothetical protein PK084_09995, partial [Novosphingobium sp.]|nr:hypothetical protein [Novosphingobium sp.]